MSDAPTSSAKPSTVQQARDAFAGQARWKKIGLIASVVFIAIGILLAVVEEPPSTTPTARGAGTGSPSTGAAGLLPGGAELPPGERVEAPAEENWSPVFLRFGFSFFVGFAIGAAARTVLRLVLLFIGLFLVGQFVLAEFGFVEVHWDHMGREFDALLARIGEEAGTLRGFFTGRLPSAGLALLGLYAGFKRG